MVKISQLIKLLILTIFLGVFLVVFLRPDNTAIAKKNSHLLPEFIEQFADIDSISLKNNMQTLTIKKGNKNWQLADKNLYPVLTDKVESLLLGLADLKIVEPKTKKSKYYASVNVNDVTEIDSKATLVEVLDAQGNMLVNLLIGKKSELTLADQYLEQVFVRSRNDAQVWLVKGKLPVSVVFKEWVSQPILPITTNQIQKVSFKYGDQEASSWSLAKATSEQEFLFENMPADMELAPENSLDTIVYELAGLQYNDVVLADSKDLDWSKGPSIAIETFDGLSLRIGITRTESKVFLKARADVSIKSAADQDTLAKLRDNARKFNRVARNWYYQISNSSFEELNKLPTDILVSKAENIDAEDVL